MIKIFASIIMLSVLVLQLTAQTHIDTLAIQDFEVNPASPTWLFTGPVVYNSGTSSSTAAPPNSPIGIGNSRAWETTTNSGGLVLSFANQTIPAGYDSIRFHFNLAAMNLNSGSGGPDHLDYVLVEVSTSGGFTYYARMRIRGATANNSFWPYSATGFAKLDYLPATEVVFQPAVTGLQTSLGYSNCEIVFSGTVTQVAIKMTGRSSSSTDTWLVDNVILTGEKNCSPSSFTTSVQVCDSFPAPSGAVFTTSGTYIDVIPNASGCDSNITFNLTIDTLNLNVDAMGDSLVATQVGANYQWLDCNNGNAQIPGATSRIFEPDSTGNYAVLINNNTCTDTSGCNFIEVKDFTGIKSLNAMNWKVFPIPSNDYITISSLQGNAPFEITVFDLKGRKLLYHQCSGKSCSVDISSFEAGIYLMEINKENEKFYQRIVKK